MKLKVEMEEAMQTAEGIACDPEYDYLQRAIKAFLVSDAHSGLSDDVRANFTILSAVDGQQAFLELIGMSV